MNTKFINTIQHLQQNNIVVLRQCRNAADRQLLAQLTQGYNHVNMALPLAYQQARRNAQDFFQTLEQPVYLENLQYAPQLLPFLAQAAASSGGVLASCTQSFALVRQAEKLANVRFVQLPAASEVLTASKEEASAAISSEPAAPASVLPFKVELPYLLSLRQRKPVNLLTAIWQGQRSAYGGSYGEYLQTVLQSDIMFLTTVSDSGRFYSFMEAAATMLGEVVNYSKLAQAAGITPPTAKTWLQFLLGTGIIYLVNPVKNIGLKRIVSTPKLYFRDTGLACELLGLSKAQLLVGSEYLQQLERNYALNKIRESYINEGLAPSLRFYHDNNKKTIDVIVRSGSRLYPLMLAEQTLSAERVQFAFSVLTEYAKAHAFEMGTGAIIYSECATLELLPSLWQISAELL